MVGRREQMDVGVRKASGLETSRHAFRGQGAASRGQRRIGLDELFINVAETRFARAKFGSRRRCADRENRGGQKHGDGLQWISLFWRFHRPNGAASLSAAAGFGLGVRLGSAAGAQSATTVVTV